MDDTSPGSVFSIIISYDMEDPDHSEKKKENGTLPDYLLSTKSSRQKTNS